VAYVKTKIFKVLVTYNSILTFTAGAIYWANNIENNLELTLKSLSAVIHVTGHATWQQALNRYQEFKTELHNYRVRLARELLSRRIAIMLSVVIANWHGATASVSAKELNFNSFLFSSTFLILIVSGGKRCQ